MKKSKSIPKTPLLIEFPSGDSNKFMVTSDQRIKIEALVTSGMTLYEAFSEVRKDQLIYNWAMDPFMEDEVLSKSFRAPSQEKDDYYISFFSEQSKTGLINGGEPNEEDMAMMAEWLANQRSPEMKKKNNIFIRVDRI